MSTSAEQWCQEACKREFPKKPAAGNVHGQPFTVVEAEYSPMLKALKLKGTADFISDQQVTIFLGGNDPDMQGKQFVVGKDSDSFHSPSVQIFWKRQGNENPSLMYSASEGYGMRLQLGTMQNGKLPGYIVLRLPDKTSVEGYFYAAQK